MKRRLYSIVNQYITVIHAGIQTAHAQHELFLNYPQRTGPGADLLWDWALEDKTIIVLEGGYQSNLEELYESMRQIETLPSAKFHESKDALNGALTAIAIVLPEYMYDPQYDIFSNGAVAERYLKYTDEGAEIRHTYTQAEHNLIYAIKKLRLKGA